MKNKYFVSLLLIFILFSEMASAQVRISDDNTATDPHNSAILELKTAQGKGLLLPRIANTSLVSSPKEGMMVYSIADDCVMYYNGTKWLSLCSDVNPIISDITTHCPIDKTALDLTKLTPISVGGILASTINYSGGNGVTYPEQLVGSKNGLSLYISAGILSSSTGSINLILVGTPTVAGTFDIPIILFGQSCSVTVTVKEATATIIGFTNCPITSSASLVHGIAVTNLFAGYLNYTGGNNGTYPAQNWNLHGITASISAGQLSNGNGSIAILVTGTPDFAGNFSIPITFLEQTCNLNLTAAPNGSYAPTLSNITPNSVCGSGRVILSATASSGAVVRWYNVSSGGAVLEKAPNFTTPDISATTIYFADAFNESTGYVSASRTPVTATVNPLPTVTSVTTPPAISGSGNVTLLGTSSVGSSIRWYTLETGGTPLPNNNPSISTTTTFYAEAYNATTGCVSSSRTPVTATVKAAVCPGYLAVGGATGGGDLCWYKLDTDAVMGANVSWDAMNANNYCSNGAVYPQDKVGMNWRMPDLNELEKIQAVYWKLSEQPTSAPGTADMYSAFMYWSSVSGYVWNFSSGKKYSVPTWQKLQMRCVSNMP